MPTKNFIDISAFTFEQFIDFVFNHEPSPETVRLDLWFRITNVKFDPRTLANHYLRLFWHPGFIRERFSPAQIELGLNAIKHTKWSIKRLIWNAEVPLPIREECVMAMVGLFRELFALDPYEHTASMWWDGFCFAWECGNRRRDRGGEDQSMQDVLLNALVETLKIDSDICRGSELHGVEHLHHPRTVEVVESFIHEHPGLDPDLLEYASKLGHRQPNCMTNPS